MMDVCSQDVSLFFHTFREEDRTTFLLMVEFAKIVCTEFQESMLKTRNSLFRASAMEKCIVQWKVSLSVMERCSACNGKFHSVQWKVYNYNNATLIITLAEKYAILE